MGVDDIQALGAGSVSRKHKLLESAVFGRLGQRGGGGGRLGGFVEFQESMGYRPQRRKGGREGKDEGMKGRELTTHLASY